MYPNPGQTGQWNPNQPPPSSSAPPQQAQQQQWAPPPQQHSPNGHNQQLNGQYAQQRPQNQMPPITNGAPPQGPPMTTLQPQHPDPYRSLPPPGQMYAHSPYHQAPIQYPAQPAPRQRTAIACRYCRRRKIRCSGFEHSEDGRCANCNRFSQECIFTPVSHQTQAFVPAHSVMARNANGQMPQQLYGAYGQPLPPQAAYYPPPMYPPPPNGYPQYPPHMQPQMGYPPPQHPGMPAPQQQQPPQSPAAGQQPPQVNGQHSPQTNGHHTPQLASQAAHSSPAQPSQPSTGQKRKNDEPHTPTHPPITNGHIGPSATASSSGQAQTSSHPSPHQNHVDEQTKQEGSDSPQTNGVHNAGYPAPSSDANVHPPLTNGDHAANSSPASTATNRIVHVGELVATDGGTSSPGQDQKSTPARSDADQAQQ